MAVQDLDVRVAAIEDRISFIMQTFRVRHATPSGLCDKDGQPLATRVVEMSLEDAYVAARQAQKQSNSLIKES